MTSISRLLKNLLKKIFGEKIYAYLGRIRGAFSPSHIRDTIALRYHYIRLRIPKQTGNPLGVRINRESHSSTKPHALFVVEKWCDGNPSCGPTISEHSFFGSLETSGLATQDRFHPDEYSVQNKRPFDTALLLKCINSNPDIIVLFWPFTPTFKTLKRIKERLQIPMVVVWNDSVNHMEEAESFLPFVDLNTVVDSATAYLRKTHQPEKYLPMWTPKDPRIFYNPNVARDIDVCFLGTIKDHPDMLAGISALRSNGIDVYQAGGQRENRLSVDEYARAYMRTKIALNFCYHPNGMVQLKAHVFEATSCGAMLMEADNSETAKWFEPMVDYVPFTDEKDLVEKVRYYLAHDAERMEIAASGHRKTKEKYTDKIFWKTVLSRAFSTNSLLFPLP